MGNLGRIDQFAWSNEHLAGALALPFAVGREGDISIPGALPRDRPFGLSYPRESSQQTTAMLSTLMVISHTMASNEDPRRRCICIGHCETAN